MKERESVRFTDSEEEEYWGKWTEGWPNKETRNREDSEREAKGKRSGWEMKG